MPHLTMLAEPHCVSACTPCRQCSAGSAECLMLAWVQGALPVAHRQTGRALMLTQPHVGLAQALHAASCSPM